MAPLRAWLGVCATVILGAWAGPSRAEGPSLSEYFARNQHMREICSEAYPDRQDLYEEGWAMLGDMVRVMMNDEQKRQLQKTLDSSDYRQAYARSKRETLTPELVQQRCRELVGEVSDRLAKAQLMREVCPAVKPDLKVWLNDTWALALRDRPALAELLQSPRYALHYTRLKARFPTAELIRSCSEIPLPAAPTTTAPANAPVPVTAPVTSPTAAPSTAPSTAPAAASASPEAAPTPTAPASETQTKVEKAYEEKTKEEKAHPQQEAKQEAKLILKVQTREGPEQGSPASEAPSSDAKPKQYQVLEVPAKVLIREGKAEVLPLAQ